MASPWRSPAHLRWTRLRRAFGRTRPGATLKRVRARVLRRQPRHEPRARRPIARRSAPLSPTANILFVSHCDFSGNSALHVFSIASDLHRRGFAPSIAVPRGVKTVYDLGDPRFPVLDYRSARKGRFQLGGSGRIDVVHAFTPREHVRELTLALVGRHHCPYVVHLEDNEEAIVGGRTRPAAAAEFLGGADGITVVVERLLELKPEHVPGVVAWPGLDEAILSPRRPRGETRRDLGLDDSTLALVYTGNVHESNLQEIRSLYQAVALLRDEGLPVVLVKTGWNFVPRGALPNLGSALRDLGWVSRARVPELLAAADVLVQPGRSDPYNDYRFPSKLPDFLASGRPVVLPRTNIGLHLHDGVEALLLVRGDAEEIREKVSALAADPRLREELGRNGRDFALRELRWSRAVDEIHGLYRTIGE